jgi:hypothetical protein
MPLDSHASVIEKGVPMPAQRFGPQSRIQEIATGMEVGDSVLPHLLGLNPLSFQRWADRTRSTMKFSRRKTRKGWRVWRVA